MTERIINRAFDEIDFLKGQQYEIHRPLTQVDETTMEAGSEIRITVDATSIGYTDWANSCFVAEIPIAVRKISQTFDGILVIEDNAEKWYVDPDTIDVYNGELLSRNPVGSLFDNFRIMCNDVLIFDSNFFNISDCMIKTLLLTQEETNTTYSHHMLDLVPNTGNELLLPDLYTTIGGPATSSDGKEYSMKQKFLYPSYERLRLILKPSCYLFDETAFPNNKITFLFTVHSNWRTCFFDYLSYKTYLTPYSNIHKPSNQLTTLPNLVLNKHKRIIGMSVQDFYLRRCVNSGSPQSLYNIKYQKPIVNVKNYKEALDPNTSNHIRRLLIPPNTVSCIIGFTYTNTGLPPQQNDDGLTLPGGLKTSATYNNSPTNLLLYNCWTQKNGKGYVPIYLAMNKMIVKYDGQSYPSTEGIQLGTGQYKGRSKETCEMFRYFVENTAHLRENNSTMYSHQQYLIQPIWYFDFSNKPVNNRSSKLEINIDLARTTVYGANWEDTVVDTSIFVVAFTQDNLIIMYDENGSPISTEIAPAF